MIDVNNDGVPDLSISDPANINGLPVAGNFDNNTDDGDEVGLFTGQTWWFDTNHDFRVDFSLPTQQRGFPIVGDFDGDGFDDLGSYNEQEDRFEFDLANGTDRGWDGVVDQLVYFGFAGVRERPVAADMNQDGVDDLGLWTPDRSGQPPAETADWYFLISQQGQSLFSRIVPDDDRGLPTIEFTPEPFASDIYAQFGDEFALPLVGNFDPPVGAVSNTEVMLTNPANALDVNNDEAITLRDVVQIVNLLADPSAMDHVMHEGGMYPDVSADGAVTLHDAAMVINHLVLHLSSPPQAALSQSVVVPEPVAHPTDATAGTDGSSVASAPTSAIGLHAWGAVRSGGDADDAESLLAVHRHREPLEQILDALADDVSRQWT